MLKRWFLYVGSVLFGLAVVCALLGAFVLALLYPTLPSLDTLTDYQPKIPLRIVSADGDLLGEFGEERRAIVNIGEVPDVMKKAILAAEDERFYQHGGVDYLSVLRAAAANLRGDQQGAGTITMQVARNFFLTREKTVTRKLREVLLAWKIEASLSKDEILQLYVNQIFLGQRAYGFAAAAQIYFGKPLKDVTIAEAAMLAGLPKAPSAYNPISNPKRAKTRQLYVLRRMHDLRYISDDAFKEAQLAPLAVRQGLREVTLPMHAEWVAEMARQMVVDSFGDEAYTKGLTVHTTIRKVDQDAAYAAVRKGVVEYDRRHGYRGPETYVGLPDTAAEREAVLERVFQEVDDDELLQPAVVLEASAAEVTAVLGDGETVKIAGEGLKFAARSLGDKAAAATRIRRGAVIRVARDEKGGHWTIAQMPQVEAGFISLRPSDGAILSLIGGFDFDRNKFNHITQAQRQPGSSFKPFIYSAALEKGFTPATIVNDAPFFAPGDKAGEPWEPKNYDGKFEGPMRVRTALARSKNLVTVRVMQAIGAKYAQDYITRFGFDPKQHPAYLSTALGAGSVTPLQMVAAYGVFANGGYRVSPYLITRIVDSRGNVVSQSQPSVAGQNAERAIDPRNAFVMTSLLKDVIAYGTGTRAQALARKDIAGKTGTTNDYVDAWFCGYNGDIVGVAWIGFDQPRTLGNHETGSVAALPIWISYMGKVLKGTPPTVLTVPEGLIAAKINSESGLRDEGGVSDYFYSEFPPRREESVAHPAVPARDIRDQLF